MSLRSLALVGVVLWGAAVVGAAVAGRPAAVVPRGINALTASVPAAGLSRIEISAGLGQIDLGVTPGDQIEIAVALESGGVAGRLVGTPAADAARTTLDSAVRGETLRARVAGAVGAGLVEHWTVRVPARLAADVKLDRGVIHITDVEGGVRAATEAGVDHEPGVIDVDVPRGALALTMGVGTIRAHTRETPPGDIDVQSRVGRARLSIDGHDLVTTGQHGSGERVRLAGDGTDGLVIRVSVGDAHVQVR